MHKVVNCKTTFLSQGDVRTDVDSFLGNHSAVGLIDDAADLLEVVRVREDLVSRDDVLQVRGSGGSSKRANRGIADGITYLENNHFCWNVKMGMEKQKKYGRERGFLKAGLIEEKNGGIRIVGRKRRRSWI